MASKLLITVVLPVPGPPVMTMTFEAINAARDVMFLVVGKDKADAVAGVLEGNSRPDDLPAQGVKPVNGNLFWLLDTEAASRLSAS